MLAFLCDQSQPPCPSGLAIPSPFDRLAASGPIQLLELVMQLYKHVSEDGDANLMSTCLDILYFML